MLNRANRYRKCINNAVKSLFKTLLCCDQTFGLTLYPISKVVYAANTRRTR